MPTTFNPAQLRRARQKADMTQVEVGLALNIAQNTISTHETGAVTPDASTLALYADIYRVSVSHFYKPTPEAKAA